MTTLQRFWFAAAILVGAVACTSETPPAAIPTITATPSRISLSAESPSREIRIAYLGPPGSSLAISVAASDGRISASPVEVVIAAGDDVGVTIAAEIDAITEPLTGAVTFSGDGVADAVVEVIVTFGCVIEPGAPLPVQAIGTSPAASRSLRLGYVPGELLVTYHDRPADGASDRASADAAARRLQAADVAARAGVTLLRVGAGAQHDLVAVPEGDVDAAAARLAADPNVKHVSRNYVAQPLALPDAYYGAQWYLWDFGLEAVWQVEDASGPGESVVIAIIDDGFNVLHVDLADKVLPGRDVYCDDDDVRTFSAHGTHVAGVAVAGSGPEGLVAGVAKGSRAKLLPVKVYPDDELVTTLDAVVRGIRWAAQLDTGDGAPPSTVAADIINLSLGFGASFAPGAIDILQEAVDEVTALGILVVAAAGNLGAGDGVVYPARLANVLAVGSVDWEFTRSDFSNYGAGLDLVAPGGTAPAHVTGDDVCLLGDRHAMVGPSVPGATDLSCQSGTSMAAAFVAGTAALLIADDAASYRGNPAAIVERLVATAVEPDAYTSDEFGYGLVCPDAVFGLGTACPLPPEAFGP